MDAIKNLITEINDSENEPQFIWVLDSDLDQIDK